MLRTNHTFLSYIEDLYTSQARKEDIVVKKYAKGERLFSQGEKASKVIVLKEGFTKCYFFEQNGKEFIVEFLGKGEIVGEIEALRGNLCLCNIEAMNDVHAYHISYSFFQSLFDKNLRFNNLLLTIFADRIVNTSSRASFQQLHTIEYSLSKLLALANEQNLSISKEDMAAYLGVTVRSLNRALKSIKKE